MDTGVEIVTGFPAYSGGGGCGVGGGGGGGSTGGGGRTGPGPGSAWSAGSPAGRLNAGDVVPAEGRLDRGRPTGVVVVVVGRVGDAQVLAGVDAEDGQERR